MRARLWLIRHGETEWNLEGRLQGSSDSPLTARGRRQSEAARDALASKELAAVYSSDLGRALATGQIIAGAHGLVPRQDHRLRELAYGQVEGLTWDEIAARHPEVHQEIHARRPDFVVPGGESRAALERRMVAALHEISEAHAGASVVVVSHGGAIASFFRYVLQIPREAPASFRPENCALSLFEHKAGRFQLVSWGLHDHLRDAGGEGQS